MRVLHHDFVGYPYPLDLSRQLAHDGYDVTHVYCDSLTTNPGGKFQRTQAYPTALEIVPLALDRPLEKFAFVTRRRQEIQFGTLVANEIARRSPDVVISANAPLDTQRLILRACRRRNISFIFWLQDLIGIAAKKILSRKIPVVGSLIGSYYVRMEAKLLLASDAVVPLTPDFVPLLLHRKIEPNRISVIENWAPIEEIPIGDKHNTWSEKHGLADKFCFIYAGTMGMKHNPQLLAALAHEFIDEPNVRIVVLSQGLGAKWLAEKKEQLGLTNLILQDFVPFGVMPDVMASADVLVAVLEVDAGVFSVPSKVLAYLCARRPILAAMPAENLASRILVDNRAGLVANPSDTQQFVRLARQLYADADFRQRLAVAGRVYAEQNFSIQAKAQAFEEVIRRVTVGR
jgi:glycosyltransferase involved in cell wall biosynthesis